MFRKSWNIIVHHHHPPFTPLRQLVIAPLLLPQSEQFIQTHLQQNQRHLLLITTHSIILSRVIIRNKQATLREPGEIVEVPLWPPSISPDEKTSTTLDICGLPRPPPMVPTTGVDTLLMRFFRIRGTHGRVNDDSIL